MAGDVILTIAYGADVKPENDPLVELAETGVQIAITVARPGHYLVDAIPVLQYIPKWFPGARFRRDAESYSKQMTAMRDIPYEQVKENIVI
jgi:hypothetical protein